MACVGSAHRHGGARDAAYGKEPTEGEGRQTLGERARASSRAGRLRRATGSPEAATTHVRAHECHRLSWGNPPRTSRCDGVSLLTRDQRFSGLPTPMGRWPWTESLPLHSGGTVPESHRLPRSAVACRTEASQNRPRPRQTQTCATRHRGRGRPRGCDGSGGGQLVADRAGGDEVLQGGLGLRPPAGLRAAAWWIHRRSAGMASSPLRSLAVASSTAGTRGEWMSHTPGTASRA